MGTQAKRASDRSMARVLVPTTERITLMPCPACSGKGMITAETAVGRYRAMKCRWCDGNGCADKAIFRMFRRWERILKRNKLICQAAKEKLGA